MRFGLVRSLLLFVLIASRRSSRRRRGTSRNRLSCKTLRAGVDPPRWLRIKVSTCTMTDNEHTHLNTPVTRFSDGDDTRRAARTITSSPLICALILLVGGCTVVCGSSGGARWCSRGRWIVVLRG